MSLTQETIEMENEYRHLESNQARYAKRNKFNLCPICGSTDGMSATPGVVLVLLDAETVTQLAPWYREPGNSGFLFHACDRCNRRGTIPLVGYERVRIIDIPDWLGDSDSLSPNYAALGAEPEAATAGQDSYASAETEG